MNEIFQCPSCGIYIEILEYNCKIFRCGIFKSTNIQISPHETKENCEKYKNEDLIYGCGKPFRIVNNNGENIIEICEYI